MTPEERRAEAVRFLARPENRHLAELWDEVVFDLTDPDESDCSLREYRAEWARLKAKYENWLARMARRTRQTRRGHQADEQDHIAKQEEALPYLDRLTVLNQLLPLFHHLGANLPYSREVLRLTSPGTTVVEVFGSETSGNSGEAIVIKQPTGGEKMPAILLAENWVTPGVDEQVSLTPDRREPSPDLSRSDHLQIETPGLMGQDMERGPALSHDVPPQYSKAATSAPRRPLRDTTRDRFVDAAYLLLSLPRIRNLNDLNNLLLEIHGLGKDTLTKAIADHVQFKPRHESFRSDFIPRVVAVAEQHGFNPEKPEPASVQAKEVVRVRQRL